MADKQNFEVNARFEYGTYLTPNAKGKNINVPSNRPDWRITLQADHIKRLEEELKAKEQECERLKKQLETKGKILTLIDEAKNEYSKENNKLKQTLAEIKEIAENLAPITDEYENCLDRDRCFECDFTEDCTYFNIKQILQKISECEAGNK